MLDILADARWVGRHGIGRFAAEVLRRLPGYRPVPGARGPLQPLDPLLLARTIRRERPDVAVGLKRGFSFFFHSGQGERFGDDASHARQLLVAASPRDEVADTHWFRPDVDQALAEAA